ncbi:MAG: undecaprenyldiphospho-muramoylpentapeptide beta-N-acetylglucosaminyltransferase [Casimicrobiaceae bacterium]
MITTGGSGGHAFPGLAVAARLLAAGWRVFWLGTQDGIEARLVRQHGIDYEPIQFAGVRGKGLKRLLLGPFALLSACWQSLRIIRRRAPDVVLGLGGFVSFPGALMAVACNRPLLIHDANAVAGLANRILAYGADRILLGFPGALGRKHVGKVEWVGNPLRAEIIAVAPPEQRFAGRHGALSLLVVGGSLGATALNRRVPAALALIARDLRPHVVHQAGERHIDELRRAYQEAGVEAVCLPFIDDIARQYADADLVLCRGGALTVSELAAVGIGSVIVPLPGAFANEQTHNAQFLVDAGGAVALLQSAMTPQSLAGLLRAFTRGRLLAMAIAARRVGRTDASERVAEACIALARRRAA